MVHARRAVPCATGESRRAAGWAARCRHPHSSPRRKESWGMGLGKRRYLFCLFPSSKAGGLTQKNKYHELTLGVPFKTLCSPY